MRKPFLLFTVCQKLDEVLGIYYISFTDAKKLKQRDVRITQIINGREESLTQGLSGFRGFTFKH